MGVRTFKISAIIITIFMISSIYFTICTNISEPVHKGLGYSEEDVLDLPWPRLREKIGVQASVLSIQVLLMVP